MAYESVVDEPQLSYCLVHLGNLTENCSQFTLETQRKTASSSSPWKPNRKLLPVRLGNPTENCFLTTYHPSFMVHWWGPTQREREKRGRERREGEREKMKRLWRE
jgi:hypothetical protein